MEDGDCMCLSVSLSSWSFGILLYEMATLGECNYSADTEFLVSHSSLLASHVINWCLFFLQVKLHLQRSQLMSFCSFISVEKVWKNLPTAPTHCKCPLHAHTTKVQLQHSPSFLKKSVQPILRYTIIKGCCQWKDQDRPSLAEVSRKLIAGEKSASDKVLKGSGTVNIEQYLQEAGYGETNSYTVFWLVPVNKEVKNPNVALLHDRLSWRTSSSMCRNAMGI